MAAAPRKLLFVDTNVWLDFYRVRNEADLSLLKRTEEVISNIVVTFQLESEFKSNRQRAMMEGINSLKMSGKFERPGIFSDALDARAISKSHKEWEKRAASLRGKLIKALDSPTTHDPVYQTCQRIFHREDELVLTRENDLRHLMRRKATRRFLHGCPPRKSNDTSFGDAFNWEWMVYCANLRNSDLVIVSRDSDYGAVIDGHAYVNDHLKQEFSERVGRTRKVVLHTKLSDALKLFHVAVPRREIEAEATLLNLIRTNESFGDLKERFLSEIFLQLKKPPPPNVENFGDKDKI